MGDTGLAVGLRDPVVGRGVVGDTGLAVGLRYTGLAVGLRDTGLAVGLLVGEPLPDVKTLFAQVAGILDWRAYGWAQCRVLSSWGHVTSS